MDEEVVTELIQGDLNINKLKQELAIIADEGEGRKSMINSYSELRKKLGGKGASTKTAKSMLTIMDKGQR